MRITCGIDWASEHHDVALVDQDGTLVAKRRINDDAQGYQQLLDLLADAGDSPGVPIPVAIETPRGLFVACLRASGRPVHAINPLSASRHRERQRVTRAKSDDADAVMLANILRTDAHEHPPLPADTEQARAVTVLAWAQQDAVWRRTNLVNELRSHLHQYYPAALEAFAGRDDGLHHVDALGLLTAAPSPRAAARLTHARSVTALRRGGRIRYLDHRARQLQEVLRREHLHQPPLVEKAMAHQTRALVAQLRVACEAARDLEHAAAAAFDAHPDAAIYRSLPGIGDLAGPRLLAEIGDDRTRFADARALKAYAGSSPVTIASGKTHRVRHRNVKNRRLNAVGYSWAMAALHTPGPRAHDDRRRATGDRHTAALRNTYNRLLGCLYHCLRAGVAYDDGEAFSGLISGAIAVPEAAPRPSSPLDLQRQVPVAAEDLVQSDRAAGRLDAEDDALTRVDVDVDLGAACPVDPGPDRVTARRHRRRDLVTAPDLADLLPVDVNDLGAHAVSP